MPKTKGEIVQQILNKFRPDPFIKKIRCGFDAHIDGSTILKCEFMIDRSKLGNRELNKERLAAYSKELANRIKRETKLPIQSTQTTFKYI